MDMDIWNDKPLKYSILDPTGNITALVESDMEISRQPLAAAELMKRHPEVEQVGFVRFDMAGKGFGEAHEAPEGLARVQLRMAGGEFCGNASMCAAALYLIRCGSDYAVSSVRLRVSGVEDALEVRLEKTADRSFIACICMPRAMKIRSEKLSYQDRSGLLPVVEMEGISHIIIEDDSVFSDLTDKRTEAENVVRQWCEKLSSDGLGLMFLKKNPSGMSLTPLVYIPGSGTVFWENSCASGTSAVGMYLSEKKQAAIDLILQEPGGSLRVRSDPATGETWLYGKVELRKTLWTSSDKR